MNRKQYAAQTRELRRWLKEERRNQGITMRDLAEKLGVSHSYIGKVELGERKLDVADYLQYCFALNLKPLTGLEKINF